uniref:EF-hand domain-containing protein n=1 Tax=Hemiselmis andersenii TaxID=464988 RepID=A0A6T8GK08_HEMAN
MERDALRKHLVAQHKAKKKERELQARIEAGLCRVDGSPLVDEEAVQRAAAQAREEEAAFQQKYQEEQRQRKEKTALVKKLRKSMQLHFHNTKTLPIDLWRAFKKFDVDDSGFIDFKEFQRVLSEVGLGNNVLTPAETLVMFQQCDDNSSGRVDFAEFLKTVVGNLTGL